jgi:hypothetical protein
MNFEVFFLRELKKSERKQKRLRNTNETKKIKP